MARKTYLQILNDVQLRLREPVSSGIPTSGYPATLGVLINDAKRRVEESWNWNELRTTLTITTAASDKLYSLTNFQERYRIHTVWNDTGNRRIKPASQEFIERKLNAETDPTGTPLYWRIFGVDGSGDPQIEFYPTPSGVETINVYATVGQADLSAATDTITVPHYPVCLFAYAAAIAERGEHGGTTAAEALAAAEMSLTDAIAQDNQNSADGHSSDWHVD